MYYKINDNILFRQYSEYGYITDNSMFGYRLLNDSSPISGERYVSTSGAVMLGALSKIPQHIDNIIKKLMQIFKDVEYDELKQDMVDFFNQFVDDGYLNCGETYDECNNSSKTTTTKKSTDELPEKSVTIENCLKSIINKDDSLKSIHIEISSECNERCVHCYIPHEWKNNTIDSDLFYKILEDGRAMNIINVTISGGEPLMHKDFIDFLKKCRELDLSVNVLSNLVLLTDEMISEMRKNPLLSVQTSLYSMNPSIHDSITNVKGSFEKTKNAVMKLLSANIPVQISCPVMKQNKNDFTDVIEWGNANNIGVTVDYAIFASYDSSSSNLVNRLSLEEVSETFGKQLSEKIVSELYETAKERIKLTENSPVCSVCRYYFCVSAEGDVFPCVGWGKNKIGNLREHSIKELWESSEELQRLRHIKRSSFPQCVKCKNRGYCKICMMYNFNENSDEFKISDFHCKVASMIHEKVDSYLNMNHNI